MERRPKVEAQHSYLVEHYRPGDESFLCVFEAASEDVVREAYARAGLSFERISTAISEED